MNFSLSTHWNAARHVSGEAMVDEILSLGFDSIELGYDTRIDLVPGITARVRSGAIRISSLHNFCPVPMGAPRGHPELFTPASLDRRERASAIQHTTRTLQFAAEVGANVVVAHAGNVAMDNYTYGLADLCAAGRQYDEIYERQKMKCLEQRDRKVPKQLEALRESIEQLIPVIRDTGVLLAFENLPTWESIPTELEMEQLLKTYGPSGLRYWHDIGHGQIRENLGFIRADRWLERLQPWLAGMHVHDVLPPATDHAMPPNGCVDFARYLPFALGAPHRVIEPMTRTPAAELQAGHTYLKKVWGQTSQADGQEITK